MPILIIRLYASKDFNVEENKRELDVPLKHLNNENLVCRNAEWPTKDAETPEKRSARLATESLAKRQQHASETDSQRVLRLQQLTSSRENRVASESNDQRAARLQHQRQSQSDKIGSETEQERAARLQQMSASQQDRIANETEQERAARQQCDAEQHRIAARNLSTVPLLDQPVVQKKLQKLIIISSLIIIYSHLLSINNISLIQFNPLIETRTREGSPHNVLHSSSYNNYYIYRLA